MKNIEGNIVVHPGELRERLTLQSHTLSEDKKTGALKRQWKKQGVVWASVRFLKPPHNKTSQCLQKPLPRVVNVIIRNKMFLSGISSIWWRYKRFILIAPPARDTTGQWASFTAVEDNCDR